MSAKDDVKAVLKQFAKAYEKKNVAGILALYEDDRSTVVIGSGADEWNVGMKQIRKQFERDAGQADTLKVKVGSTKIDVAKDAAWIAGKLAVEVGAGGQAIAMSGRFTGTLRRSGKKWRFVQTHFSMPFGEQAAGESFPMPGAAG